MVDRSTERYRRRRAQGLCGRCGKVETGIHAHCDPCLAAHHLRRKPLTEDQRQAQSARGLRWRKQHPNSVRESSLRRYGLSLAEYNALLEGQGHGCAICGATIGNGMGHRLYVDHDHTTGKVRGLLCASCNFAIGHLREQPATFAAALAYLRQSE